MITHVKREDQIGKNRTSKDCIHNRMTKKEEDIVYNENYKDDVHTSRMIAMIGRMATGVGCLLSAYKNQKGTTPSATHLTK